MCPPIQKKILDNLNDRCSIRGQEYAHVEQTTSSLAIAIESDRASYDASSDIDGDGEQVGGSGTVSDLYSGEHGRQEEFLRSTDTWFIIVGRNNEKAYRGAALPAYISTGGGNVISHRD